MFPTLHQILYHPCSIPRSRRSPEEGNDNPLQYSCQENSMDRGAWWTTVHGVTKGRTHLSDYIFTFRGTMCGMLDWRVLISLSRWLWGEWEVLFKETGIPNSSYAGYNNEIISGILSVGTNKSRYIWHFPPLYLFLYIYPLKLTDYMVISISVSPSWVVAGKWQKHRAKYKAHFISSTSVWTQESLPWLSGANLVLWAKEHHQYPVMQDFFSHREPVM